MHTLLITITTTQRSIDLELPAEVPISTLMSKLLDLCGPKPLNAAQTQPSQWTLWSSETRTPLRATQSLLEAGVVDGVILVLQNMTAGVPTMQQSPDNQQLFRPETIQPSAETGGIGVRWNVPEM